MGAARGGGDCGPVRVAEAGREDYSTSKLHEPTKPIGRHTDVQDEPRPLGAVGSGDRLGV